MLPSPFGVRRKLHLGFPGSTDGKESACNAENWVRPLGWEDSLEESMATHSSILAWRIPMDSGAWWATYSPWGHKESDMTERLSRHILEQTGGF